MSNIQRPQLQFEQVERIIQRSAAPFDLSVAECRVVAFAAVQVIQVFQAEVAAQTQDAPDVLFTKVQAVLQPESKADVGFFEVVVGFEYFVLVVRQEGAFQSAAQKQAEIGTRHDR